MPATLTGIRAVVFDLDDTLYPEADYALSGFAAVGAWLMTQIPCPADPAARLAGMFRAGRRTKLFDALLAEWGHPNPAALVPQMVSCYRQHIPSIRLHDDAARAIARWRGTFRLGLITDGPLISQRRKVEALNLGTLLDQIICTDQWGPAYWKPHPHAFETLQRDWDLPGQACVYIADNPSKDFLAPNQLRWRSVQVVRPDGQYRHLPSPADGEPSCIVSSMDEVDLTSDFSGAE